VLASSALPDYGIEAHVFSEIAPIPELRQDRFWFALLVSISGGLIIVVLEAGVLYLRSVVRARAHLWEKAHFDGLTGLANRELFRRRLVQAAESARSLGKAMALLLVDLDGFKEINDTFGHGAGDQILQQAARRIAGCVRGADTVARLGGDEFTIVMADVGSERRALDVATQIVARMALPFHLRDGVVARISVSLGVALLPDDAADIDALFARADEAMYDAKRQGGNRYARYVAGQRAGAAATPARAAANCAPGPSLAMAPEVAAPEG
jgi:diguanylate cyclase (GGDEF)-like protein